jgi:hypothetical protein
MESCPINIRVVLFYDTVVLVEGVSLEESASCNEVFSQGFKLPYLRDKQRRGGCEWPRYFPSTAAPRVEKKIRNQKRTLA